MCENLSSLEDTDEVYISILTLYEFEYGYANAPDEKKTVIMKKIEEAQKDFEVLPLLKEGSQLFGVLKKAIKDSRKLNKESVKKHNIDIILAVTAMVENCILVSADSIYVEIQRLNSKLILENWLKKNGKK
ncbi:MAG: PIN domain-containing protein [Thiomargarita sp.]|nr:PIN domain-containing protein [Thiomargarita sp.]